MLLPSFRQAILAAALTLVSCAPSAPSQGLSAEAQHFESHTWPGGYVIELAGGWFRSSLTLDPDGSYFATIHQGYMTIDGCAGPFAGDGQSQGTWSETNKVVTFEPKTETPQLAVSFRGATAEFKDGVTMLYTAGESSDQVRLMKQVYRIGH